MTNTKALLKEKDQGGNREVKLMSRSEGKRSGRLYENK